eukprot:317681-Pleurochrysis_carterae.AAC.1
MMYKRGHPVATLPSDGGDCTPLSRKDINFVNQRSRRGLAMGCWSAIYADGPRDIWMSLASRSDASDRHLCIT